MERDEIAAELADVVRGPVQLIATELRSMIALYRQAESEAKAGASEARSVPKLHAAELRAASAKGAAEALTRVVRVLDNALRPSR